MALNLTATLPQGYGEAPRTELMLRSLIRILIATDYETAMAVAHSIPGEFPELTEFEANHLRAMMVGEFLIHTKES